MKRPIRYIGSNPFQPFLWLFHEHIIKLDLYTAGVKRACQQAYIAVR